MSTQGDAMLVQRAKHGDPRALGMLTERYRGAVFGLCLDALNSVEDAQDATQDTFLRACLHLEQLRDPAAFPAWLAAIARRECSGRLRKGVAEPERLAEGPPTQPDPTERLARQEAADRVRERLASLGPETRLIYLLSCLDGLTSCRVAAFLGTTPGAVRARLVRARRRLGQAANDEACEALPGAALNASVPEVIVVTLGFSCACGRWPEGVFPDEVARALYGYVYTGVVWPEAVARVGLPEAVAQSYLRTWERYAVVERDGGRVRPRVPVCLAVDRAALRTWHECLARRWVAVATKAREAVAELAEAAAPGGWTASAREALCLWFPLSRYHVALAARGMWLPPLARPSGTGHLFGWEQGCPQLEAPSFGVSDSRTGDDEMMLAAVIWYDCRHSSEVGRFLDRGGPFNPLPRILVTFREAPPGRAEALGRLEEASTRYRAEGRQLRDAEDLLDRLAGWQVISADEPYRLLVPAFIGKTAGAARHLADRIAEGVAEEAEAGRAALEELIRSSSFADCNRSDVLHLVSGGVFGHALQGLIEAELIPPFPDACFADRGPFIYERETLHAKL
jgi:RNA polymerase sigma-70 factor (ECF subfamily)